MRHILSLLFTLLIFHLPAATLHGFLIADTLSPTGKAAEGDFSRIKRRFEEIADHTGDHVVHYLFTGEHVNTGAIMTELQALDADPQDMIIVYYLGHGYESTKKNSPWPRLYLSASQGPLDLDSMIQIVTAKHPRLGLIVADCCNNVLEEKLPSPLLDRKYKIGKGFRVLFCETNGIIVASSTTPGESAYCFKHGHYFTDAFWRSLYAEVRRARPNWNDLLTRTCSKVEHLQNPRFEIRSYAD